MFVFAQVIHNVVVGLLDYHDMHCHGCHVELKFLCTRVGTAAVGLPVGYIFKPRKLRRPIISLSGTCRKIAYFQMYAIVEFDDGKEKTVEIVPCAWLNGEKYWWPNVPPDKAARMAKKGQPPGPGSHLYDAAVKGVFGESKACACGLRKYW